MTMEGAMENYMYDRIATELDDASGIDGFGSFFNQKVQEAQERAAQHKAMRGGNLLDFNQQFRHNELFRETVMMTIPGGQSSFSPISRVTNAIQQEIPGVRDIVNMPGNLLKNAMGWNQLPENWTSMNSEELQKAMDGKYTRRALREQMNDRLKADYKNLTKLSPKEIVPYATELIQESYLYNKLAESLGEKQMTDAERTFRESTSQIWADATGISLELAESLYVDQLSLDKALENEFYRQFEEQVQLDGAGDYLRELKEEADLRKKLHAGRRNMNAFNPEYLLKDPKFRRAADVISMGSSKFLFENKVFNYDDLLALQAGDLKGKALLDKISGIDAMNQYSKFNLGTGFQEIIQSTALGTLMTVMSKPQDQMSAAEYEFRTSLAEYTAWAFGAPEEFMKTIMVEEGDLETAIMNQFWQNVEDQYGVPGLGDVLAEEYQKALERKAAHEAARIKPEDIVLMPSGLGALTYIWRNAEHNKTLGTLVQLAETVGSAVAAATGVGLIAVLAYQTAKQTYTGSLHGGTQGALVGLYSGLANGALAMAGSPVNFNLSYDFENGFSGSVGANVPIAEGSPWSVGGRLNFTEETGLSGFSLSGGYTHKGEDVWGTNLSLDFDNTGLFRGGNISGQYGITDDWNGTAGISFDEHLAATNYDIGANYNFGELDVPWGQHANYQLGGGLRFTSDGDWGLTTQEQLSWGQDFGRVSNISTLVNNAYMFDREGNYTGPTQNIQITSLSLQSRDTAAAKAMDTVAEMQNLLDKHSDSMTPEQIAELERRIDDLERNVIEGSLPQKIAQWRDGAKNALIEKIKNGEITDQEELLTALVLIQKMETNQALTEEEMNALASLSQYNTASSNTPARNWSDELINWFRDTKNEIAYFFGADYEGPDGMVDPETGEWKQRTCFVAGTLVRVHPETEGANQEDNGNYYKKIEEIQTGDLVLSWNEESGEISYQPVTETFVRSTPEIYEIIYEDGTVVETTWSHRFYIENKEWVNASDLQALDKSVAIGTRSISERTQLFKGEVNEVFEIGALSIVSVKRHSRKSTV
ncbi:MAG: hypothetical protein KDK34_08905, partial [Leptospiraceae bacterium]|nr:hypothetical protein [Leptospiraceae bacterium]